METIPAQYWMIVIGVLSAFLTLILYYIAMFLKESTTTMVEVRQTVKESREVLAKANTVLDTADEIVSGLKETSTSLQSSISETADSVLQPVQRFGSVISTLIDFLLELINSRRG